MNSLPSTVSKASKLKAWDRIKRVFEDEFKILEMDLSKGNADGYAAWKIMQFARTEMGLTLEDTSRNPIDMG